MTVLSMDRTGAKDWRGQGNCIWTKGIGPSEMYPSDASGVEHARRVCLGTDPRTDEVCPLLMECLEWAVVTNEIYGFWGGHGQRERVRVRNYYQRTGVVRMLEEVAVRIKVPTR